MVLALALASTLALALAATDGTETRTKVRFPRLLLECNQTSASQLQPCRFLLRASTQHRTSSIQTIISQAGSLPTQSGQETRFGQYQDQQIDRQMYASASSQAAKVLEDHRAEEMALPWARQMQYRIKMYLKDAGTLTESKF